MNVAFVPSAPFLLPALSGGPAELRSACAQAISVLRDPVVVLGAATPVGWRSGAVDPTPWGARGPSAPDPLPLPLAVGSALLGDRPHRLLAVDGAPVDLPGDVLVVGDGSARRSEKAPGHLDPRAEAFDALVLDGLAAGCLPELDAALAGELLVGGVDVWRTVRSSVTGSVDARVLYAAAPFGVGYVVATWIGS